MSHWHVLHRRDPHFRRPEVGQNAPALSSEGSQAHSPAWSLAHKAQHSLSPAGTAAATTQGTGPNSPRGCSAPQKHPDCLPMLPAPHAAVRSELAIISQAPTPLTPDRVSSPTLPWTERSTREAPASPPGTRLSSPAVPPDKHVFGVRASAAAPVGKAV